MAMPSAGPSVVRSFAANCGEATKKRPKGRTTYGELPKPGPKPETGEAAEARLETLGELWPGYLTGFVLSGWRLCPIFAYHSEGQSKSGREA